MSNIEFYIIDTETNGLRAAFHEITEICCIRVSDRVHLARNIVANHPERSDARALEVTGKTKSDLARGVSQENAISVFEEFISQDGKSPKFRCVIAHQANFDMKFIHALWAQHNKSFPIDMWVDTVPMCRKWVEMQGLPKQSVKLALASEMLGAKVVQGVHNAVSDTQNLYFVWKKLIESGVDYLDFIKLQPHTIGQEEPDLLNSDID